MSKKYEDLYKILTEKIEDMLNNSQIQFENERELSAKYNVSRQTVRKTLELMQQQGLIEKIHGSGIYLTGIIPGQINPSIALIVNDEKEYTTPSFISEFSAGAAELGLLLNVYSTNADPDRERNILKDIAANPPRLVIAETIIGISLTPNYDLFEILTQKKVPVIFLGGVYQNLSNSLCVKFDNYKGAYSICEHLLSKGYKNIAGIFQDDITSDQEKLLGYSRCLIEHDLRINVDNLLLLDKYLLYRLRKKNDTNFISKFVSRCLHNCDAVICSNDEIAYHLIRELSYANIHVPSDIRVLSFDNSYLCTLSQVSISSMAPRSESMCNAVLDTVRRLIKHQPCSNVTLEYNLIERKS